MNLFFLVQIEEGDMQIQLHTEINDMLKEYDSEAKAVYQNQSHIV
jgi:hypothetical protein